MTATTSSIFRICQLVLTSCLIGFGLAHSEDTVRQVSADEKSFLYWDVPETLRARLESRFGPGSNFVNPMGDFERVLALLGGGKMGDKAEGKISLKLELLPPNQAGSPLDGIPAGFRETASEIDVSSDGIVIRAESLEALSGGLYKLLEDWGCRWILPGELGEVIPHHSSLALPIGRQIVKLGTDTGFGAFRSESATWIQRNRLLQATWLPCFHYWNHGLDPETNLSAHPEYFALVDGERKATQPETVNPEVIRLKVEHAKEFFRKNPSARTYPSDPEDNTFFSESPGAVKLDPPGVGQDGLPLMTDRVVAFANAIREGFKDEFPDKMVGYYSYLNHSLPPVNVKPDPQTTVGVTRFGYCSVRMTPSPHTPSPAEFETLVKDWLALTPNVYIYDYNPPSWGASLPFPNYVDMAESMRRLHAMGAKGFYSDTPFGEHAPGVFLNSYIRRRMMVDPTQEPQALMKDYCQSFFGPAADKMQAYYDALSVIKDYHDESRPAVGVSIYGLEEIFPREAVARASGILSEALKVDEIDDTQRKRLEWVKAGHDYLVSYLQAVDAAKAGKYEEAKAAFDRTMRSIAVQERLGRGFLRMDDARRRIEAARSTLLASHFPKEQGMVTQWKLLGPIPRTSLSAADEQAILTRKTPASEVTAAGETYRWKPYSAPGGMLDFNAAFQRKGAGNPLSKAFAQATVQVPERVDADIFFSSFYPFSVYLNGRKVFVRDGFNFDFPDANKARVTFEKGTNHLVIECDERAVSTRTNTQADGFDWSTSLALRDLKGQPMDISVAGD